MKLLTTLIVLSTLTACASPAALTDGVPCDVEGGCLVLTHDRLENLLIEMSKFGYKKWFDSGVKFGKGACT